METDFSTEKTESDYAKIFSLQWWRIGHGQRFQAYLRPDRRSRLRPRAAPATSASGPSCFRGDRAQHNNPGSVRSGAHCWSMAAITWSGWLALHSLVAGPSLDQRLLPLACTLEYCLCAERAQPALKPRHLSFSRGLSARSQTLAPRAWRSPPRAALPAQTPWPPAQVLRCGPGCQRRSARR